MLCVGYDAGAGPKIAVKELQGSKRAAGCRFAIVVSRFNAEITEGYADNLMPEDYGDKLTEQQLADLVAFLVQATHG